MYPDSLQQCIKPFDKRRRLATPGDKEATLNFCVEHFIFHARTAMEDHGFFSVALSGGSTPKAIFARLAKEHKESIDWSKVYLFWGDERCVGADHPESNYKMAFDAGFSELPLNPDRIFRMKAEENTPETANKYEELLQHFTKDARLDLVLLGMGGDGHTASLFPHTEALSIEERDVVFNTVPQLDTERMTLTFSCINRARACCIYVLGGSKAEMVTTILKTSYQPSFLPAQAVGTEEHKALWILDDDAGRDLFLGQADTVVIHEEKPHPEVS